MQDVTEIGTTKLYKLKYFKNCDFTKKRLEDLTREDFANYTLVRRKGEHGGGSHIQSNGLTGSVLFKISSFLC